MRRISRRPTLSWRVLFFLLPALGAAGFAQAPFALSPAEQAWAKAHPVVRVGFSPAFAPYSFPDGRGGLQGIDLDFLNLLAARTGLVFQPVVFPNWPAVEAAFAAGEVDLLTTLMGSAKQRETMLLSPPYISVPAVIVSRTDSPYLLRAEDLRGLTLGFARGYVSSDRPVEQFYAGSRFRVYESAGAVLEALARGEIDATVSDAVTAAHHIRSLHLTNLRLGSVLHGPNHVYLGVSPAKPELAAMVARAVASFTPQEKRAIDERWIAVDVAPSRWFLAFKIAAGLAAAACVAGLLLFAHERRMRTELAERRRIQAELAERSAELAARVAEVETLNARLVAANAELDAFSYSVSHDLRAPLRNICGFVELAELRADGAAHPEVARHLGVVKRESLRMSALIDDLLAFARVGRAELAVQTVSLGALVAEVSHGLAAETADRAVEWRVGPLPEVVADPALLRQVFANLLGNAVKFTRRRHPAVIEVGAEPAAPDAREVVVFVRDNGAGFDPAQAARLFGVFQRLHSARDFEGTGVGLALVHRIVTRHGGRVWAEAQPDRGATFHLALPTATPPAKTET